MRKMIKTNTRNRGIVILPVLAAVLMISLIIVANYQMMISQMGFQSTVEDELALAHQAGNIKEVMNAVDANAGALIPSTSPSVTAASFLSAATTALNNQLNDGALMLDSNNPPRLVTTNWSYRPFTVTGTLGWQVPDTNPALRSHILYTSLGAVYAPVDTVLNRPFTLVYNLVNTDSGQTWVNELQYLVYEFSTGDTALTVFGGLDASGSGTLPLTIMGGTSLILGDLKVDPGNTGSEGLTYPITAATAVKLVSGDLQGIHGQQLGGANQYTSNMYTSGSMPWNKESFTFKSSAGSTPPTIRDTFLAGSGDDFNSGTYPMNRQSYRSRAAQRTPNETDFPGRESWVIPVTGPNSSMTKKSSPANPSSNGGSPIGFPNGPSVTDTNDPMFNNGKDLVPVLGAPVVNTSGTIVPYTSALPAPRITGGTFAGTRGKYVNLNDFAYSPATYMYLDGGLDDHIILEMPQRRDEASSPAPNPNPIVVVCRAPRLTIYLAGTRGVAPRTTLQARPIYLITDAGDIRLLTRSWPFNRNSNGASGAPLTGGSQPMVLWGRLGLFSTGNIYFNRLSQFNGVGQSLANPLFVTDGVTLLGGENNLRPYPLFNGGDWDSMTARIVVRDFTYPPAGGLSFADLAERVIYVEAQ
jgi:hypothetical protein